MTEETRKQLNALLVKHTYDNGRWLVVEEPWQLAEAAYELGEKAGRSEKKDSLSTKHLHETE